MERDFLGLTFKESLADVKETTDDGGRGSAFGKGAAIQWPLLNRVSAPAHFMTPNAAKEEWDRRAGSIPHSSSGIMAMSAAHAFDPMRKGSVGEPQKAPNLDRKGNIQFSAAQNDAHFACSPHDSKMFLSSNSAVAVPLSNPRLKLPFATAGHDLATLSNAKEQSVGIIPVTSLHSMLCSDGSVPVVTGQCNNFKGDEACAQLTIFYKGTVNTYDGISPEKAHAIMLLAGNACPTATTMGQSRFQAPAPNSKPAAADCVLTGQPVNSPPRSAMSSPISVSSHPAHGGGNDDAAAAKPSAALKKLEPPNSANSLGAGAAHSIMSSAVPQARKASLARFLEKRKERVMNVAPYSQGKKGEECTSPVRI